MRCSFVITAVSLAICCELLGNPLRATESATSPKRRGAQKSLEPSSIAP